MKLIITYKQAVDYASRLLRQLDSGIPILDKRHAELAYSWDDWCSPHWSKGSFVTERWDEYERAGLVPKITRRVWVRKWFWGFDKSS